MSDHHQEPVDRELLVALRRLADEMVVPPPDPRREAALLVAFDEGQRSSPAYSRAAYGWMMALATAAALLIVVGIGPGREGRRVPLPTQPDGRMHTSVSESRGASPDPVMTGEFVPWPGARDLPALESGELVRVELPVSMLPSLGMIPPATRRAAVKADVIVGQDGLARAVRLVSD